MENKICTNIQKSLAWCQGTPELPGIKKRVYFVNSQAVVEFPRLPRDEFGRATGTVYEGDFVLAEGAVFHYIDHLPAKAQVSSETQGEIPSQTFKNKVTIVHPGVGAEASDAGCSLLNQDNIFLVEDMKGNIRVIGSPLYSDAVATVAQDLGQGATGSTGTTITLEASDEVSLPTYTGKIPTEDGVINGDAEAGV
ncbi:MAG: hypothetical protein DBY35_06500 [Bacteroidales bacterium]|nr:MAG: hypothetical protein DBY35_06500 [Bacteroidales bacterium]